MTPLVHIETLTGPFAAYGADINSLAVDFSSGMTLTAYAGSGGAARLVNFSVSGTVSYGGDTFLGAASDGFQMADFGTVTVQISVAQLADVLNVTPGDMQGATDLTSLHSGQASDQIATLGIDMGANSYLVATQPNGSGLTAFQVQGDGSLIAVAPAPDPGIGPLSDLASLTAYGQNWVLGAALATDTAQSYTIDGAGALTHVAGFGAPDGLGIATPTKIVPILLEGQPHILMASSDSGSLSILRLEADGSFTATDHILDNLHTRFDNPTVLETTTVGDTTFVLAAGSDDGFSLFRVLPDGKLHHLNSFADTAATTLNNVSAAAMGNDGGILRMFLSSGTETGLSHFSYDLSTLGGNVIGSSGADTVTGTGLDDVVMGGAGDDTLSGGAGRDILVDGAGMDSLIGGTGADVFTFVADGDDDTIQDFERGVDALDLSYFSLLNDPNTLGYVATAFGATLTFQGETLTIRSADFNPLSLSELIQINPFNVDRPALVLGAGSSGGGQTQIGAGADDNLMGSNLDDILSGNGGDDILTGGAGADALFGGIGFDTAAYGTATTGITLDMQNMVANSGDAAGDSFTSIEAVSGSGLADQISGTDGNETLLGQNGSDMLTGRGGDDILNGGYGFDVLNGGAGADTLIGGGETDQAAYGDAVTELRIDLLHTHRNTGEAAGDTYQSIEDLSGSNHNDAIYGDGSANTIWGLDGDDWLLGRGGDDTLNGGFGDDILDGGAGADALNGGAGIDRAQYFTSKQGITVNLDNPSLNTGLAFGDSYTSIEDVAGSRFGDQLTGNTADNRLYGNSGNDRLDGAAGNDQLFGGAGADLFAFGRGWDQDTIRDFDPADLIELDIALLGGTAQDGAAVIADYGSLTSQGAQFDFGAGDILTIDGISDLNDLASAFTFA